MVVLIALGIIALIAAAFVLDAVLVLLAWNWLGLHSLFGAGELSFWQAFAVGVLLGLLTGGGVRANGR